MDSTKEFLRMEHLAETVSSHDESMDHQSKKHKSFDESLELCSMDDSIEMLPDNEQIHQMPSQSILPKSDEDEICTEASLKEIIEKVMRQHNMKSSEYDQVYHKLKERLREEKDEKRLIARDLIDIKQTMSEVSALAKHRKRAVNEGDDDIETARKAFLSQGPSNLDSNHSLFFDNQLPKNVTLLPDTPQQRQNSTYDVFDSNEKKLLLDQIKDLQGKYQAERTFYLEENDKLHSLNDEYSKIIDDYKSKQNSFINDKQYCQDGSLTNSSRTGNTSSTVYSGDLDHSSGKGLFDWPIDDPINDEIVTNDCHERTYTPTNTRMLHVLSDIVKAVLDTENDIHKHLQNLGLDSIGNSSVDLNSKRTFDDSFFYQGFPSIEGGDLSDLTGEGLLEDHLTSGNSGAYYSTSNSLSQSQVQDKTNEVEDDVVLVASKRLRSAVERVLKILSNVVESQTSETSDLQAALQNESVCRDKLTRQLLDNEALIAQLKKDKKTILEQTSDYFAIKNERDQFKAKADEYEKDRDKFVEEMKKFNDEKQQFAKGLPELQMKLSKENDILNKDLTQLQTEREDLLQKINFLTQEIETLKQEKESILEKKNAEFDDILCQIESQEKNFHSMKQFMEEQTVDRENEREEYNREILNLQNRIKEYEKNESKLSLNVKNVEDQLALLQEERNGKDGKIEEMEKQAKLSSVKISELNMNIKKLEKELFENQKVKELLRHRLKDVCQNLNLKTSERLDWEELLQVINNLVDLEKANLKLKNVKDKNLKVKFNLADSLSNDSASQDDNSVFLTINLLNNKLKSLNEEVDALIEKNRILTKDLEDSTEKIDKLEKIREEKENLEKVLFEFKKENQLLQDEINDNHLKYSELKVKVENSIDVQHFKRVVDELEGKLNGERSLNENLKMRLEQTNRDFVDLEEKLSAHEKEIKSYKELVKSYENQQKTTLKDKNEIRDRFENLNAQFGETNLKMLTKDKTIAVLEQNFELLKSKLRSLQCEKDVYLGKLKSMDENQNQVIVYEKNMDKLRLQFKMAQDRVNFLDLEVKSLKKKTEILERENQVLKVENFKIKKSKTDSALAARNAELDDEPESNGVGAQNILMLKVRRLSGQKNALIYQKNYLLHLLDSCQSGEMDTLAVLDRLNEYKDFEDVENHRPLRGKAKFRSVAYALIAVRRMKWLANLWQCRKQEYLVHRAAASLIKAPFGALQNGASSRLAASSSSMGSNSSSSSSPSGTLHRVNFGKNALTLSDVNSTMKGFVDRLHNVHDTLGLQTKKL